MNNVNFIVKLGRSIEGCSKNVKIYTCKWVEYDHCQNDGIAMTLMGISGTSDNIHVRIPSMTTKFPKLKAGEINKEGTYDEIILENMEGRTVQRFTYRGR